MSTVFHTFTGKVNWAQVFRPNKFNNYSIDFYPESPEVRRQIKALGIKSAIKEDNEGNLFYTFRRPHEKMMRGELVTLGPPKIVSNQDEPFTETIGNGSVVEITLAVYDWSDAKHGSGKGTRIEKVKVISHVKYQKPTEETASVATVQTSTDNVVAETTTAPALPF